MKYTFERKVGRYTPSAAKAEVQRIEEGLAMFHPTLSKKSAVKHGNMAVYTIEDIVITTHTHGIPHKLGDDSIAYALISHALVRTKGKTPLPTDLHLTLERLYS